MYISFIKGLDPEAKWFVHSSSLYSFDKKIDGMVIIDESGDSYESYNGFGSNSFVIGLRGNLNGRTVICGDAETLAENPYIKAAQAYPNLEGTGLFFDSDYTNPLYYTLAAEVLTVPGRSIGRMISESKLYLLTEDLFAWTLAVVLLSLGLQKIILKLLAGRKSHA